jgi:hypothetical protein
VTQIEFLQSLRARLEDRMLSDTLQYYNPTDQSMDMAWKWHVRGTFALHVVRTCDLIHSRPTKYSKVLRVVMYGANLDAVTVSNKYER